MAQLLKPQYEHQSDRHSMFGMRLLFAFSVFAAMLFLTTSAAAQGQTIEGKITDADTKETMPGVTVSIPALKIGAKTNSMGEFKIKNAPAGKHVVEARLIGYQTQSKSVDLETGGTVTANFSLAAKALQQNEVIVMGLSGEVDRKKLGNAIGNVEGKDVEQVVSPNAVDAISGRIPGVNVQRSSGTPGSGTFITIRGRKTISGSSEPLYVVDGTIIDNSSIYDEHQQHGYIQLANRAVDINSLDIESIQVLKGASASAIYGSLAANGVVLITTKKGSLSTIDKTANVAFTASYETGNNVKDYPLQTMYAQIPGRNLSWGKKLPDSVKRYDHATEVFRMPNSFEQNVTISGGSPEFNYMFSGTNTNFEGNVKSSDLGRQNLRLNVGANILPKVDIQSNFNYINSNNNLPQDGSNLGGIMLGALRTPPEFDNTKVYNDDGTQHRFYFFYDNPFWTIQNNPFNASISRFMNNTEGKWQVLDWLNLTGRVGYDHYENKNTERLTPGTARDDGTGKVQFDLFQNTSVNTDLSANVHIKPVDELDMNIILGGQTVWGTRLSEQTKSTQTVPFYNQISAGTKRDGSSLLSQSKTVGLFAQLTGTYLDRLTLTAALRRDGSSTFGISEKFHNYPKFGLSYVLSSEDFMKGLKGTIDNVKIRASYGQAGSPSLPGAYSTNFSYSVYGENDGWGRLTQAGRAGYPGIRQGGGDDLALYLYGNANINPETSIEREIGLDLGLFDNVVSLEFTYYYANINDLILNVTAPGSSGYDRVLKNGGSMYNKGFEIGLTALPIRTENFQWSTTVNYSKNNNLVTSLSVKPDGFPVTGNEAITIFGFVGIDNVAIVGKPLGVFRGLGYKRDAKGNKLYSTGSADDYFGKNYIGAPIIDDSLHILGDPNPKFQMSWSNTFKFLKNFEASFLVDASIGQDVWNGTRGALYRFGAHGDTKDRADPWIYDGHPVVMNDSAKTPVTREAYYRYYANSFSYDIEEPMIEDGSFVKLREVTFAYNWHGLSDHGISNVRFMLSGRNLATWTKYTGFDPEVNNFGQSEARGFDYFNLPPQRAYRFSIALTY